MQESSCGEGLFKDEADSAGNKAKRWERIHIHTERETETIMQAAGPNTISNHSFRLHESISFHEVEISCQLLLTMTGAGTRHAWCMGAACRFQDAWPRSAKRGAFSVTF